jgi:hypothetical protein
MRRNEIRRTRPGRSHLGLSDSRFDRCNQSKFTWVCCYGRGRCASFCPRWTGSPRSGARREQAIVREASAILSSGGMAELKAAFQGDAGGCDDDSGRARSCGQGVLHRLEIGDGLVRESDRNTARRWIQAGIALASDPRALVKCPRCDGAYPTVSDEQYAGDREMFSRIIRCPTCGAEEALERMRTDCLPRDPV